VLTSALGKIHYKWIAPDAFVEAPANASYTPRSLDDDFQNLGLEDAAVEDQPLDFQNPSASGKTQTAPT
jgi:hypothetical protein